jgi:ABC-type nitrate/sulfonate/bicarbonate transport system substrate-binding protein
MFKATAFILSGLMVAAGIAAAPAFAQTAKAPLKTVTRGTVSTTAIEWPDIIARKMGFYTKEGLNVEQALISPTTITPSLIGGTIQFGFINASSMVLAAKAGADLVAIGKGADPSPYSLVTGKSIKTIADLRGKTLSLSEPGDVYAEATKEILRKGGLNPDTDLNIRYGGNSNQRMAALVAGAVDAVPLVPPQDKLLLDQGFNAVAFYPDFYPRLALSTTAVSRAWAKANAETVKAFLRAQAAATVWLYDPANKQKALDLLIEETKTDQSAAAQSYDVYLTKLHMFPMNGCVEAAGFESLIAVLSKINKAIAADEPVSKYIDTQYCPQ